MSPKLTKIMRHMGQSAAPAAPAFYPTTLPNPNLIVDSIQSTYEAGGGAGLMSSWEDLSGNANHPFQDSMAAQPTYDATGASNGLPSIVMGAFPIHFKIPTAMPDSASTFYLVASCNNAALSAGILGNPSGLDGFIFAGAAMEYLGNGNGGYAGFLDFDFADANDTPFLMTMTNANLVGSANSKVWKKSVAQTNTGGSGSNAALINRLGRYDDASVYNKHNGRFFFFGHYAGIHDSTTRAAMEAFLIARFAIA